MQHLSTASQTIMHRRFLLIVTAALIAHVTSKPTAEKLFDKVGEEKFGDVSPLGHIVDPVEDIKFYLYTRSNPDEPVRIYVGNLNNGPFDPSKATKFFAHGYNDNGNTSWVMDFKDIFLRLEDCNVISIDWREPARGPFYRVARNNVNPVGEYVAQLYDFLANLSANTKDYHCMGFSLGAHVCAFSGKFITAGSIGRITGLDPARPLFRWDRPEDRLNSTDADYVDVIHTCGGYMGFIRPIGQADFFPNDGTWAQPGCGLDLFGGCSHSRSVRLFEESMESEVGFVSVQCDSWDNYVNGTCDGNPTALLGYPSDPSTRGNYYLHTNSEPPYAQG